MSVSIDVPVEHVARVREAVEGLLLVKEESLAQAHEVAAGEWAAHERELGEVLALRDQLAMVPEGGLCEIVGRGPLVCEVVESSLISGVGRLADAVPPRAGEEHGFLEELGRLTGLAALLSAVRQKAQGLSPDGRRRSGLSETPTSQGRGAAGAAARE